MIHARSLGDVRLISFAAGQLGHAARAMGQTKELAQILQESLDLATETGDRLGIGMTIEQMAVIAQTDGDVKEARRLVDESIRQFREIGDTWFLAHALNLAGHFALAADEITQAQEGFKQAGSIAYANQALPNILDSLVGLAMLRAKEGCRRRALEMVLFVLDHPSSTWDARERAEKLRAEVEPSLKPNQIEAARARAQSMSLDEIGRELTG
jgi:tetratricopeptide (TPR) repeat protein